MNNLLLRSGLLFITAAGIFIAAGLVALALFSFIILIPGILLYRAGMAGMYNEFVQKKDAPAGIIDVTPQGGSGGKLKSILKSGVTKLRNFLNKYAE